MGTARAPALSAKVCRQCKVIANASRRAVQSVVYGQPVKSHGGQCVCVCRWVCCIHVFILSVPCMHTNTNTRTCMHPFVHTYIHRYVCMYIYMYIHLRFVKHSKMFTFLPKNLYIYIYMYIHMYIYLYVCTYITCIHRQTHRQIAR